MTFQTIKKLIIRQLTDNFKFIFFLFSFFRISQFVSYSNTKKNNLIIENNLKFLFLNNFFINKIKHFKWNELFLILNFYFFFLFLQNFFHNAKIFFFVKEFLYFVICIFGYMLPILLAVAYFTLAERKILATLHRREGPSVVGFWGFLQPLVDGFKLFLKEVIIPSRVNIWFFWICPFITISFSLLNWSLIPLSADSKPVVNSLFSLLIIFTISSLGTYSLILSAWASNSKYAMLGCLRAVSQLLSYEILLGFCLIWFLFLVGSLNLTDIVNAQKKIFFIFPLLPLGYLFFILSLAETNRIPFDLPESESELVSGYHTEYSSILFAFFIVAEYANIILMSILWVLLFIGGWFSPFWFLSFLPSTFWLFIKSMFTMFLFIFIRAALPRYRYDQLLNLSWRQYLFFLLTITFLFISICLYFSIIPINIYVYQLL